MSKAKVHKSTVVGGSYGVFSLCGQCSAMSYLWRRNSWKKVDCKRCLKLQPKKSRVRRKLPAITDKNDCYGCSGFGTIRDAYQNSMRCPACKGTGVCLKRAGKKGKR